MAPRLVTETTAGTAGTREENAAPALDVDADRDLSAVVRGSGGL
jgi:hypothetical protein